MAELCEFFVVCIFVVREEEMKVLSQFSDANTLANVTPPSKATANVWCCCQLNGKKKKSLISANSQLIWKNLLLNF